MQQIIDNLSPELCHAINHRTFINSTLEFRHCLVPHAVPRAQREPTDIKVGAYNQATIVDIWYFGFGEHVGDHGFAQHFSRLASFLSIGMHDISHDW